MVSIFLYTDIWHIDQVIGGYRMYGLNRSHTNDEKVKLDIANCLEYLMNNISIEKKLLINKIKYFSEEYKFYNNKINGITVSLRGNYILKLLPFFIYERAINYLYRLIVKLKNKVVCL